MGKSLVTANKGEWGEIGAKTEFLVEGSFYDFIYKKNKYFSYLLHDGEKYYPIKKEDSAYPELRRLLDASYKLCHTAKPEKLLIAKPKKTFTFENPPLQELCKKLGFPPVKVDSKEKADLILYDDIGVPRIYLVEVLGASAASFVNAETTTIIRYKVIRTNGQPIDTEYILDTYGKQDHPLLKREVLPKFKNDGYSLIFKNIPDEKFSNKLSEFGLKEKIPELLLVYYFTRRLAKTKPILDKYIMEHKNPAFAKGVRGSFYRYLWSCIFEGGPRGTYEGANNKRPGSGMIFIIKDKCVLIDADVSNWWETQIEKCATFDVSSQGRHKYGFAFCDKDGDICMDLCLGIRGKFNLKNMIPNFTAPSTSSKKTERKSTPKKQPENLDSPEDFIKLLKL